MSRIVSRSLMFLVMLVTFGSCFSTPQAATPVQEKVTDFKYIYIAPAKGLTIEPRTYMEGNKKVTTQGVNPAEIIKERLTKAGYIVSPTLTKTQSPQTLIVNFGETTKSSVGRGKAALEIRIQFVSAKTYREVYSCVARGSGATDEEEISDAINNCLNSIFP